MHACSHTPTGFLESLKDRQLSSTRINNQLRYMHQEGFTSKNGARRKSVKFGILIVDNKSTDPAKVRLNLSSIIHYMLSFLCNSSPAFVRNLRTFETFNGPERPLRLQFSLYTGQDKHSKMLTTKLLARLKSSFVLTNRFLQFE